ncbi:hypothetical protein ACTXT7_004297 [Hymenolepis weldensis]
MAITGARKRKALPPKKIPNPSSITSASPTPEVSQEAHHLDSRLMIGIRTGYSALLWQRMNFFKLSKAENTQTDIRRDTFNLIGDDSRPMPYETKAVNNPDLGLSLPTPPRLMEWIERCIKVGKSNLKRIAANGNQQENSRVIGA